MTTPVYIEVTNTLTSGFTTGFQRLTRELVTQLTESAVPDDPIEVIPVRWCERRLRYRRLTDAERRFLGRPPGPSDLPRSRLGRIGERLPAVLAGPARRAIHTRTGDWLRVNVARAKPPDLPPAHPELEIGPWTTGSIFLDLEAAWHDPRARADLLPELVDAGVIPMTLVADVLPELRPEWFDNNAAALFRSFLRAHMRHSRRFICISRATETDLRSVAPTVGVDRELDCRVVTMGGDFRTFAEGVPAPIELSGLRYLLCVSTLEPRKNQALLLDAYEVLRTRYPDVAVVLVGRVGWKTERLVERITSHPDLGRRVFWYDRVDDALLDRLYRDAFLSVTPSYSEGFGVPVIEALGHGVPTLSSNGGALPEAGGELAEYFAPTDLDAFVLAAERHLFDERYHAQRRDALRDYRPPTWAASAQQVRAAVVDMLD